MRAVKHLILALALLALACESDSGTNAGPARDTGGGGGSKDAGATDAPATDTPAVDTAAEAIELPPGYGAFCAEQADCDDWGLHCFQSDETDVNAFCSTACNEATDCPDGLTCKPKAGKQACSFADICDPCAEDANCGPDAACLTDNKGNLYCAPGCMPDLVDCPIGTMCEKAIEGKNAFFCVPKLGACVGDGGPCEACRDSEDCDEGLACHQSELSAESFCVQGCSDGGACPDETECVQLEKGALCLPVFNGQVVDSCAIGEGRFCDPCDYNFQCRTGVCYKSNDGAAAHCSRECYGQGPTVEDVCLSGTDCVWNGSQEEGSPEWACTPPVLYECSGWKQCLGVECKVGEVCDGGYCK